ncbi:hypothetical protein [Methylorubrum populi]|uniref:hypothetical protein n=1 Tax=Methylorubrum populi TaxID=223967 RepID=UPI0010423442|nr:hypothetical protein [Methylorubrum populi]
MTEAAVSSRHAGLRNAADVESDLNRRARLIDCTVNRYAGKPAHRIGSGKRCRVRQRNTKQNASRCVPNSERLIIECFGHFASSAADGAKQPRNYRPEQLSVLKAVFARQFLRLS